MTNRPSFKMKSLACVAAWLMTCSYALAWISNLSPRLAWLGTITQYPFLSGVADLYVFTVWNIIARARHETSAPSRRRKHAGVSQLTTTLELDRQRIAALNKYWTGKTEQLRATLELERQHADAMYRELRQQDAKVAELTRRVKANYSPAEWID